MTEQLIEQGNVQRAILAEFRTRISPELLERLFASTSLLHPSFGRTNYLRQVVRESRTCDANFDALHESCKESTGEVFGRRAAFRMGIVLGLMMSEQIPHTVMPQAQAVRPGDQGSRNRSSAKSWEWKPEGGTMLKQHPCTPGAVEISKRTTSQTVREPSRMVRVLKNQDFGMTSFDEPKMPKDLDAAARRKWVELTEMVDLGEPDGELLASYCRNHSNLMDVRKAKKAQQKAKQFTTMTVAKNGSTVLNPLIVAESRLMQAGGRMLVQLGISGNGKRQETLRKPKATAPPAGMTGPEPPWGWAIEAKLVGDVPPLAPKKPWKH